MSLRLLPERQRDGRRVRRFPVLSAAFVLSAGLLAVAAPASSAATVLSAGPARQAASAARPAGADVPDGVPAGAVLKQHVCKVVHTSTSGTGEKAVQCADLWESTGASTDEWWGGNEIICELPSGALKSCNSIEEIAILAAARVDPNAPSLNEIQAPGTCGTPPHSPCGARRVENVAGPYTFNPFSAIATCNIWGASAVVVVTDDNTQVAPPNIATPHMNVPC
ncbi:MAG TPA: hypothetical protein VH637_22805 [Streptosporangiaceae bacterium]|jgi:hypothetical protein